MRAEPSRASNPARGWVVPEYLDDASKASRAHREPPKRAERPWPRVERACERNPGIKKASPMYSAPTEPRTEPMRGPGDGGPSGVFRKSVFEGQRPYMFEVGRTGGMSMGWSTHKCEAFSDLSKTARSAARLEAVFDVSARYSPSSTGWFFENEWGIWGLESVFEAMFVAQTAQNRRVSPADDLTKNGEMFYSLGCSNEEMSGRWMRRREGRDRDATRLDGRFSWRLDTS